MGRYLLRRLLISIPVLIGITIAMYAIVNLAPGDPVTALLNPEQMSNLGPEWVEEQRQALGLNDPLPLRYLKWLGETVQGNLGYSTVDRQPVAETIGDRIWPTLKLMLTVIVISVVAGITLGVLSALKQHTFFDYLMTFLGFLTVSIPGFFLGLILIYVFALRLDWLPATGMYTLGQPRSFTDDLAHIIMPATVLGLAQAAPIMRYTRASLLDTIGQDYVTVARAKGLKESRIVVGHSLRNALIPIITIVALNVPSLLGGTVVIEQVFAWPGMGTLAISSVTGRDYNVLMGINLIVAIMILLSNLLADVIYAFADPRIKYA
ncbi:MAG TPA: ABC transporter permease [Thermomicrobiales bacterium]|nr:ABC transporter permease [Thermomicrobiales bacterium]